MKIRLLLIWTLLSVLSCQTIVAQKVLLLQKSGTTKRYLYHTGDKILVRLGEPQFVARGTITYLDDSLCTLNRNYTFPIVKVMQVDRKRHWFYSSWSKFIAASFIYAGGSIINRSIKGDKPVIDNTIPIVSGSLAACGAGSLLLRYHRCKKVDHWNLKVLDFDIYKERYETKE